MSFKVCNLGSKYPYFNRAYIVSVKTQLHTSGLSIHVTGFLFSGVSNFTPRRGEFFLLGRQVGVLGLKSDFLRMGGGSPRSEGNLHLI